MADSLKIRNWDRWQSYRKDRGQPPWIKVHREVMRNPDWVRLSDAERGQLVAIWLLAADRNGVIPASPGIIAKLCYMDSEPDLQRFADLGFIEPDAALASTRRQLDANMTCQTRAREAEAEAETETEQRSRFDDETQPADGTPPAEPEPDHEPEKPAEPKDAQWHAWLAAAESDLAKGGITKAQVRHVADEAVRCLGEAYAIRGGRMTPTRLGYIGRNLARYDPETGLVAMEIFCDAAAGKDERYLVGIARRLHRLSDQEFASELKRHRERHEGRGVWAGRPR